MSGSRRNKKYLLEQMEQGHLKGGKQNAPGCVLSKITIGTQLQLCLLAWTYCEVERGKLLIPLIWSSRRQVETNYCLEKLVLNFTLYGTFKDAHLKQQVTATFNLHCERKHHKYKIFLLTESLL